MPLICICSINKSFVWRQKVNAEKKIIMSVSFQQIDALFSMHTHRLEAIILFSILFTHAYTNMCTHSCTRKQVLCCLTGNGMNKRTEFWGLSTLIILASISGTVRAISIQFLSCSKIFFPLTILSLPRFLSWSVIGEPSYLITLCHPSYIVALICSFNKYSLTFNNHSLTLIFRKALKTVVGKAGKRGRLLPNPHSPPNTA